MSDNSIPQKVIFAPETEQYHRGSLNFEDLEKDPSAQFHKWFKQAQGIITDPEALIFSTARLPSGRVSSRTVLMKELDINGNVVIYSNWETSKKAQDIKTNSWVSLVFLWKDMQRQVRIEGIAERISTEESQIYYDTRPRDSRISAWASPQSTPVASREVLEDEIKQIAEKFNGVEHIPCPPFWGGLRIKPIEWEFWNGRPNRSHDRFSFTREDADSSEWKITRLAP